MPSKPPDIASKVICSNSGGMPHMNSAGSVKMTPLARELEAEPVVCEILVSRIVPPTPMPLSARNTATVMTATGIDVLIVRPARRPRYALAAPKMMPNRMPRPTALNVNSAGDSLAGTNGS